MRSGGNLASFVSIGEYWTHPEIACPLAASVHATNTRLDGLRYRASRYKSQSFTRQRNRCAVPLTFAPSPRSLAFPPCGGTRSLARRLVQGLAASHASDVRLALARQPLRCPGFPLDLPRPADPGSSILATARRALIFASLQCASSYAWTTAACAVARSRGL